VVVRDLPPNVLNVVELVVPVVPAATVVVAVVPIIPVATVVVTNAV
jgi:hypothetical protein